MDDEKFAYLKDAMSVAEIIEEMNICTKDLRNAEFRATFDPVNGVREGFSSMMQVWQDVVERLEEKSPDPEHDDLITSLYNVYNALEDLRSKCDYL